MLTYKRATVSDRLSEARPDHNSSKRLRVGSSHLGCCSSQPVGLRPEQHTEKHRLPQAIASSQELGQLCVCYVSQQFLLPASVKLGKCAVSTASMATHETKPRGRLFTRTTLNGVGMSKTISRESHLSHPAFLTHIAGTTSQLLERSIRVGAC